MFFPGLIINDKMAKKIIAIVPAHNEARHIGPLVESLCKIRNKRNGIIHEVLVVDDGSTDNTAKIAKSKGASVIRLKRNSGKAFAVYKGAQEAAKRNATIIVTSDADIMPVTEAQIDALIRPIGRGSYDMSIGTVFGDDPTVSGQRAIRIRALMPLLRPTKEKNWEPEFGIRNGKLAERLGYGLEDALNEKLRKNITLKTTTFNTARRMYGKTSAHIQFQEMKLAHYPKNAEKKRMPKARRRRGKG